MHACRHFLSWQNSIHVAQHVSVRPFCKLTKQLRVAFNKHKLQCVLHIQCSYRMAHVCPCGPVAFVRSASPVCPLVLMFNSMRVSTYLSKVQWKSIPKKWSRMLERMVSQSSLFIWVFTHEPMCVSTVYSVLSCCEQISQACYSGGIRTHDLCNFWAVSYQLHYRGCPVARGSSNPKFWQRVPQQLQEILNLHRG